MQISTSSAHIAAQAYASGTPGVQPQRPQATPRRVETADFVDLSPNATPAAKPPGVKPSAPLRETQTVAAAAVGGEGAARREAPLNRTDARLARPGSVLDIKV